MAYQTKEEKVFGFSLIEIMIVLIIIAVLSTMAVPGYKKLITKTKQTEPKNLLNAIHTAQKLYFLENNKYTTDLKLLDLTVPKSKDSVYEYTLSSSDPLVEYLALAKGNIDNDPFLDEWTINQDNILLHKADDYDNYTP